MSFKDITPEKRAAMVAKAAATRRAKAAIKAAPLEAPELPQDAPPTLASLGFGAATEYLSTEEIAAAQEAGRKRYRDEQRSLARKAAVDAAYNEARSESGAVPPDEEWLRYQLDLVQVRIQMPTMRKPGGGELPPEPIIIDQKLFVSGRTYTVERHVGVYLASLMDLARRHVNQVDGRSRTYYSQEIGTMVYQGGEAKGGGPAVTFDAIHKRAAA